VRFDCINSDPAPLAKLPAKLPARDAFSDLRILNFHEPTLHARIDSNPGYLSHNLDRPEPSTRTAQNAGSHYSRPRYRQPANAKADRGSAEPNLECDSETQTKSYLKMLPIYGSGFSISPLHMKSSDQNLGRSAQLFDDIIPKEIQAIWSRDHCVFYRHINTCMAYFFPVIQDAGF
jgi:hypothetical protein